LIIKEISTSVSEKKTNPNMFIVDEALVDEYSTVSISPAKMQELSLFAGDTVILKGKKRKETIGIVNPDDSLSENRMRVTKVMRSNMR
jgi:transitional endoplasmic reticulum ATPase